MSSPLLLSRFQGSLLGAIFGDCLGAKFEGMWAEVPYESVVEYYKDVRSKVKNKVEKDKGFVLYTDDSCMTIDLAESLVQNKGYNPQDVAKNFSETYFASSPQRFYGANVPSVFYELKKSNYEGDVYGPAKKQFSGTGSYGNGSGMRVSPVPLFYHSDPKNIANLAAEQSMVTHTHPKGINGAILQALATEKALNSNTIDNPVQFCNELYAELNELTPTKTEISVYDQKIKSIISLLENPTLAKQKEINMKIGSDVTAHQAVPAAIFSFLYTLDPKRIPQLKKYNGLVRAVILAAAFSEDSDTVASMAGAIAGAYYGVEMIPEEWKFACEGGDRALHLAEELYNINQKK